MSCTITKKRHNRLTKVSFACVSAAGGTASGTTTDKFSGEIVRAVFVPGTSGNQPTDNFDVVINDDDGYDALAGQGANLSNAAATTKVASMGAVVYDYLSIAVSNAGDTKQVTAHIYLLER
jgi:hypothetical protein